MAIADEKLDCADQHLKALHRLDLEMIGRKLMEPLPEGYGWSEGQLREAEMWYRRYLELILRFPNETIVPNGPIDIFWHQHILDTRKYAADCMEVFGRFIHHYPYFGLNGDSGERDSAFDETNDKYLEIFGEDCRKMSDVFAAHGRSCNSAGSGTGCSQKGDSIASESRSCNSAGSGTGCSQKSDFFATEGRSCNSAGSGTGCSQKLMLTSIRNS